MADIVDSTDNVAPLTNTQPTSTPPSVNAAPTPDVARVNQQRVLSTAVQPRFVNIVTQTPASMNPLDITDDTIFRTEHAIGDGTVTADNVLNFNFKFTGVSTNMVFVELATTIFIDEVSFENAYPFGDNVFPAVWNIEQLKVAHSISDDAKFYSPNQVNQDTTFLVVKNFTGVPHKIIIFYYWRSIINSGGQKR